MAVTQNNLFHEIKNVEFLQTISKVNTFMKISVHQENARFEGSVQ
jgi:hypothetical protein